jgi:hypothetical protein
MRHPSIRGIGIRYVLALTLPITGVALVLYTLVQLIGLAPGDRRSVNASPVAPGSARVSAISGSTAATPSTIPQQAHPAAAPRK